MAQSFREGILIVQAQDHRHIHSAYEGAKQAGRRLNEVVGDRIVAAAEHKGLFDDVPCIVGERIVLDRVVDSDADALRDLIDNPHVQRYLPAFLFEKRFDDVHEAIRLLYGDLFASKESLIMAIRGKGSGELAGLGEFYGLRAGLRKASMGYRLREAWWHQGLATEAARLMLDYAFGQTDIAIVTASSMIENVASAHVLEKVGFVRIAHGVKEDWGFDEPATVDKWFATGFNTR